MQLKYRIIQLVNGKGKSFYRAERFEHWFLFIPIWFTLEDKTKKVINYSHDLDDYEHEDEFEVLEVETREEIVEAINKDADEVFAAHKLKQLSSDYEENERAESKRKVVSKNVIIIER